MINGHDRDADATNIAIDDSGGKVIWHFSRPTEHLQLDPQNAFEIAEATARAAHRAKFNTEPPSDAHYLAQQIKSRLTEDLRDRMVIRAMHVIRSLQESARSPDYVARQVVDIIFAEVA